MQVLIFFYFINMIENAMSTNRDYRIYIYIYRFLRNNVNDIIIKLNTTEFF